MNCQNRLTAGAKFSSDAAEQWKNGLLPSLRFEQQRTNRRLVSLAQRFASSQAITRRVLRFSFSTAERKCVRYSRRGKAGDAQATRRRITPSANSSWDLGRKRPT